jgi:hypothetical protein
VRGRFEHRGDVVRLPSLELEGQSFRLLLSKEGRIGPGRRLELEFELRLRREPEETGLAPLRKVWTSIREELWKPFAKFVQFRIEIYGTLDRPVHRLRPPEIFGK